MTLPPPAATPLDHWLDRAWAMQPWIGAVPVEGATVRYRGWGLDAADRPGLLFVHGFLAHAGWWDHIAPHFADRYRVAALDFTGMGDSDRRPAYSRRQYAREIVAVADAADLRPLTLVAHSFGSVSSLFAARIAPGRIERVIVIDAHVFREEDGQALPVLPERTYPTREQALDRYRLLPAGAWPIPRIVRYIAEQSLRQAADGRWGWKFDPEAFRTVHKERIRDEIRSLDLPIDFIHAADSEVVGPAELASFLANQPRCPGPVTVPLSHHHIMIEQPAGLVAALNGILTGR